ncbi:TPA: hypothetical protein QDC35_007762, partial [Burkholderia aenigmatica]|nr:hypothetical protein [Burkholderia aenigmatica]
MSIPTSLSHERIASPDAGLTEPHGAPDASACPDARARETEARMTDDERFSLLYSLMIRVFGRSGREPRVPADLPVIAGYVPGVPRLGVPALK